jgi:hypothetical protein
VPLVVKGNLLLHHNQLRSVYTRPRPANNQGTGTQLSAPSGSPGPFAEFYAELAAKGIRPEMARLTLARKMVAIVLIVWKRGVRFDAQHLKPQTA